MGKFSVLALAIVAVSVTMVRDAAAGSCRGNPDSPMVTSESFGIASCKSRGARYHSRDHIGEGAWGYARRSSSDPMVWDDGRWRSSLFGGYAGDYDSRYDRRFRRMGPHERRVVHSIVRVIITNALETHETASEPVPPRRAKLIHVRDGETDIMENRAGFAGHKCSGILVLTWGAAGSRARCFNGQGRIRSPL